MKKLLVLLLLGLTSCVSGPKAGTTESFSEVDAIYNKFNSLAESHGKAHPYEFRYMFTPLKDNSQGQTLAGCVTLPTINQKLVKNWEKLSAYNQENLLASQNKPFIFINPKAWNRIDSTDREIVLFHELGHCYLNLEHVSEEACKNTKTIMCRKIEEVNTRSYYRNSAPYTDDLFK